jgi:polysaccharide biosynthesis PFTS motif protein
MKKLDKDFFMHSDANLPRQAKTRVSRSVYVFFLKFAVSFIQMFILSLRLVRTFRHPRNLPSVFVFSLSESQIFRNKSTKPLIDFLRDERFELGESSSLLIEGRNQSLFAGKDRNVTRDITIRILISFLDQVQLRNVNSALEFLKDNLIGIISLNRDTSKSLLKRILDYSVWELISFKHEVKLVTTNSSMSRLPNPFYIQHPEYKRVMLWYSGNHKPIQLRGVELKTDFLNSDLISNVDLHYVWDESDIEFLKFMGINRAKAVGSILMYNNTSFRVLPSLPVITFFDITPFKNATGFYTEQMSIEILMQLVQTVQDVSANKDVKISLQVKPKRQYTKKHSSKYIKLINALTEANKIKLLTPTADIYQTINRSNLILATPFSAPAIVAKEMGIPCAFIYSRNGSYDVPLIHNGIEVISEQRELTNFILKDIAAK